MAHIRQSRADLGDDFQVEVLNDFKVVSCSLRSGMQPGQNSDFSAEHSRLEEGLFNPPCLPGVTPFVPPPFLSEDLKGVNDFDIQANATTWPVLSVPCLLDSG